MGPTIILDKSVLHGLSLHEMGALNRYYTQNIAPVIIIEILGDLKKEHEGVISQEKVAILAQKAFPSISNVNAHYLDLIKSSLMGLPVPMDGRIILPGGCNIEASDGQKGVVFENTPEEKALLRWREHQFSEGESIMAERWRTSTRGFDLEQFKKNLSSVYPRNPAISDSHSLFEWMQEILAQETKQLDLLTFMIYEFGIEPALAQRIFYRWETEGKQTLNTFAPYAYYCCQVSIFFNMGLIHNVVSTKPTNRVDLEYIYYLPFCNAFCSGDKFHHMITPLFLRSNQSYFRKDEFKSDLAMLSDDLHKHGPAGCERTPAESPTAALWADLNYRDMTEHGWISPEQQDSNTNSQLVDFIKSRCDGKELNTGSLTGDHEDFVIKKTTILGSDPCPCGSRKSFDECHGKLVAEKMKRTSEQED